MKHFFRDSFGVDSRVGAAKARVVSLDLRDEANQELAKQWCLHEKCLWTHLGVPCGTSSRARLKRMSKHRHGPPPLRNEHYPLGLPHITGDNLARVRSANILYRFTCELILDLARADKVWTLENPWSSLLWWTPYWKMVETALKPHMIELHYCMFGGHAANTQR